MRPSINPRTALDRCGGNGTNGVANAMNGHFQSTSARP